MKIILCLLLVLIFYSNTLSKNPEWIIYDYYDFIFPSENISDLAFDENGDIWLATSTGGKYNNHEGALVMYDKTDWTIWNADKTKLLKNLLWCIEIDNRDNIWIGTAFGLLKFDRENFMIFDTNNSSLPYNSVYDLAVDSNNVKWLATLKTGVWGGGLASFDEVNWKVFDSTNCPIPELNNAYSIFVDRQNNKWIGLDNKSFILKYDDNEWSMYDTLENYWNGGVLWDFAEDSIGNIWVGWYYPVKFDGENWIIFKESPKKSILSIAVEDNEVLWFGCGSGVKPNINLGGLVKFENDAWTVWDTQNSPIPGDPQEIQIDKYGNKWLATGGGLAIFREGGVIGITDVENDIKVEQNKMLCYPNPTANQIKIRYRIETVGYADIFITNALGLSQVLSKQEYKFPGDYIEEFDLSALPQGMYNVVLRVGDEVYSEKVVIFR